MSKLEDRIPNAPLDLEDILERGRAVDVLRQTLDALGPNGEHWVKDTARSGDRRCLAQTMWDIAKQADGNLNEWADASGRPNFLTRAGLAIIESKPQLAELYLRNADCDDGEHYKSPQIVEFNDHCDTKWADIKSACLKGIEDLMSGYAYNEQRELELI